jgi:hypothetical protein
MGVATRAVNLESMPLGNDAQSWVREGAKSGGDAIIVGSVAEKE